MSEEIAELRRLAQLTELVSVQRLLLDLALAREQALPAATQVSSAAATMDTTTSAPATTEAAPQAAPSTSKVPLPAASTKTATPLSVAARSTDSLSYSAVPSYAWDQTSDSVKLYISLEGTDELPAENVSFDAQENSIVLRVVGLKGNNYRFTLTTAYSIVPAQSTCKSRKQRIILTLKKKVAENWKYLSQADLEKEEKKKSKFDKDADPSKSIMDMMKQLYDEGDDEMKRTIGKAMAESRAKTGAF